MNGYVFGGKESTPLPFGPAIRTEYIIHYVMNGSGTYICNGKKHRVNVGESFIVHPNCMVEWFPKPEDPWGYIWAIVNSADLIQLINQIACKDNDCVVAYQPPDIVLPLFEHLERIGNGFETNNARIGIAYGIVGAYLDAFKKQIRSPGELQYLKAVQYIESNFRLKRCSPLGVANELNISNSSLYRIFKSNCGESPENYIQKFRIRQAKQMLENGLPVKEVAFSCGFSDSGYFTKVFKKLVGVTPTEYGK